ncbi:hypothetical protein FIV07_28190 (plasmid) [Mycobacterium sp. THAF192]|nr:hypothetical protein FIV07_28190 [Mycobacterium sp. THAF192]
MSDDSFTDRVSDAAVLATSPATQLPPPPARADESLISTQHGRDPLCRYAIGAKLFVEILNCQANTTTMQHGLDQIGYVAALPTHAHITKASQSQMLSLIYLDHFCRHADTDQG